MRKVRRYTKEQRGEILLGYKKGEMKLKEYCQEQGIPASTFHTWRRNYPQSENVVKKGFIKVNSVVRLKSEGTLTIETPKGYRVNIPTGADEIWVQRVIEALKVR